ncbi:MAG: FecR family protein, partial [Bacteroidota bacterium]|nr:FecR family protein [Bacteroidota bacterium]MDP4228411.1 FecR family protein [Bacteroidota bacterium]
MKERSSYLNYTVVDLLNDAYFLDSELNPTKESRHFWADMELYDQQLGKEIHRAHSFLKAVSQSQGKRLSNDEINRLWQQVQEKNAAFDKTRKIKRTIYWGVANVAACVALFIAFSTWFHPTNSTSTQSGLADYILKAKRMAINGQSDVRLLSFDDKTLKIAGRESEVKYTRDSMLAINSKPVQKIKGGTNTYNQLIVPAGKRSYIIFSDGTRMNVNANTRIVYPVTFSKEKREVYVEGEAYLQVSPDKNRPFIVKTDRMNVQVLGTAFDVCTSAGKMLHTVVLVHGRVQVQTSNNLQKIINPGEMLSYQQSGDVQIIKNVNVSQYISWVDGYYEFHEESIQNIADKLMQHYGKKIVVSPKISNVTFSGKLD